MIMEAIFWNALYGLGVVFCILVAAAMLRGTPTIWRRQAAKDRAEYIVKVPPGWVAATGTSVEKHEERLDNLDVWRDMVSEIVNTQTREIQALERKQDKPSPVPTTISGKLLKHEKQLTKLESNYREHIHYTAPKLNGLSDTPHDTKGEER